MPSASPCIESAHQPDASPARLTENEKANMKKEAQSDHGVSTTGEQHTRLRADEVRPATNANHPKGWRLGLLTVGVCLAIFLISLDFSIVATAIPKITSEFRSLGDVGWYGSSYLLTTASTQLLFGKFYTVFNLKWVFLISLLVFEVGSVMCAAAPSSVVLILGRAIAGCGNAGLLSGALLILTHSVPLEKRPLFLAMTGGTYGVAAVAGPPLGGAFTDRLSWRWCFWINLPIGAVTLLAVTFLFKSPKTQGFDDCSSLLAKTMRFGPLGTIVFMPVIICILLALQWGGSAYAWESGHIIALFVIAGVLLIAFAMLQWRMRDDATLPLRIVRKRMIWSCATYQLTIGAAFFILIYFVPNWFQAVQGVSAVESGIRTLPMLVGNIVATTVAGVLVLVVGQYAPFIILGTMLTSVGAGMLTLFNTSTTPAQWIGYQALVGLGIGFGWQQAIVAVQTVLDITDVPIATAVLSFAQTLGGSVFVGVAEAVFSSKLSDELASWVPRMDPDIVLDGGVSDLAGFIPEQYLSGVMNAYNSGLVVAFTFAAAIAVLSVFGCASVEWNNVKEKQVDTAAAV